MGQVFPSRIEDIMEYKDTKVQHNIPHSISRAIQNGHKGTVRDTAYVKRMPAYLGPFKTALNQPNTSGETRWRIQQHNKITTDIYQVPMVALAFSATSHTASLSKLKGLHVSSTKLNRGIMIYRFT
jgi:hypothetical protein